MLRQLQAQIVLLQAQLAALSRPSTAADMAATAGHELATQVRSKTSLSAAPGSVESLASACT